MRRQSAAAHITRPRRPRPPGPKARRAQTLWPQRRYHGRGALKDTSQARLELHGLRQEQKAVTNELEGDYWALSQKEQDKKKRKRDVSEVEHAVELSNEALNKNMITYRKKKARGISEQIEAAVKKLREDKKENFEVAEEAVRVEGLRSNRSSTDSDYMGNGRAEFVR